MRDGKNANDRNGTARENGTPEKGSGVFPADVSWRVAWALESGMAAVSATFESALDRVVETWGKYRRLWLVRHFDYEDSEEARQYLKKSKEDKSKMDEDGLRELNELSKKVRANVDDPFIQRIILGSLRKRPDDTKAALYLDIEESIATRNKMTYEWVDGSEELKKWFVTKRFKITTEKVDDTGEKTFRAFSEIDGIMNDWLSDEDRGDGVIFGNRTPSHAFWLRVWRPCYSEKDHTDQMERLGYDFWDVEKATGKPILIQNGKTLRVTLENLDGIEKAILDACDDADRKKKVSIAFANLPLIMLQEAVNDALGALRTSKPDEYLVVLRSLSEWKGTGGKHDPELQSYVFERLMESWFPWETLLRSEWSTGALEWMATKGYREMVIRYFWESEEGPVDSLGPFAKSINVKGMKELFADAHEYWKIRQRQKRSVDPAIRDGAEGAILERSFVIRQDMQRKKWPFRDFGRTFAVLTNRPIIVEWTVGSGKSLWMAEFAKYAILRWIKVERFEAKSFSPEKANSNERLMSGIREWKTLLFIDGFDELQSDAEKVRLYGFLEKIGGMTVVGSRPGEFKAFDKNFAFVHLEPLTWEEFSKAHGIGKNESEAVSEFLSSKFLAKEVSGNPLMLSMFKSIAAASADEDEKFRNWKIPKLSEIRTDTELYEAFCRFVLASHGEKTKGTIMTRRVLEGLLDDIWQYAHDARNGTEPNLPEEDIREYASILQKDETGYAFAHASFEDFFLLREMRLWKGFSECLRQSKKSYLDEMREDSQRDGTGSLIRQAWVEHERHLIKRCYWYFSESGNREEMLAITETLSSDEHDEGGGAGYFLALGWLISSMWKNPSEAQKETLETLLGKAGGWSMEKRLERMRLTRDFFTYKRDSRLIEILLAPVARLAEDCWNHDGKDSEISKWSIWFENGEYSKLEYSKTSLLKWIESLYADLAHTWTDVWTRTCVRALLGQDGRRRFGGFGKIIIMGTLLDKSRGADFNWISELDNEGLRLYALAVAKYRPDFFEEAAKTLLSRISTDDSGRASVKWLIERLSERLPEAHVLSLETANSVAKLNIGLQADEGKSKYLEGLDKVIRAVEVNRRLQYGN